MICPICGRGEVNLNLPISLDFDTDDLGAPDSVAHRLIRIKDWDSKGDSIWYCCGGCWTERKAEPKDGDWTKGAVLLDKSGKYL